MLRIDLSRAKVCCTACVLSTEDGLVLELTRRTPALILSDLTIPGFDGFAALRIAKSLVPTVPVILWSSGGVPERQARRAHAVGAYGCVAKDDVAQLVTMVRRALGTPATAEPA